MENSPILVLTQELEEIDVEGELWDDESDLTWWEVAKRLTRALQRAGWIDYETEGVAT